MTNINCRCVTITGFASRWHERCGHGDALITTTHDSLSSAQTEILAWMLRMDGERPQVQSVQVSGILGRCTIQAESVPVLRALTEELRKLLRDVGGFE